MCGLVGYYGASSLVSEKAFENLLRVDVIRGPHSTGVAFVKDNKVNVVKQAVLPDDLFETKEYKDASKGFNDCFIGHNRYATMGLVNDTNAHPFEFDHITGVHNGTLKNRYLLPESRDYSVDSENIFYAINKDGIGDTWEKIHGAAALVWWDTKTSTLNMCRNKERPLFYCYTKDNAGMYWASEVWMLEGVLARHDIKHGKIYNVNPDQHLMFKEITQTRKKTKSKTTTFLKTKRIQMGRKDLVAYTPPVFDSFSGMDNNMGYGMGYYYGRAQRQRLSNLSKPKKAEEKLTIGASYEFHPNHVKEAEGKVGVGNGYRYIGCTVRGDPRISIRVPLILESDERLVAAMKDHDCYFKGRIFSATHEDNKIIFYQATADSVVPYMYNGKRKSIEERQVGDGVVMTRAEFDEVYKDCSCCGDPISFDDKDLDFLTDRAAFCSSCSATLQKDDPILYEQCKNGVMSQ